MLKTWFLFFSISILLSTSAAAQCGQRDISGTWNVLIGSTKAVESLSLTQSGTGVSGRADLQTALNPYKDGGKVTGRL
jgi:hypothetical protein